MIHALVAFEQHLQAVVIFVLSCAEDLVDGVLVIIVYVHFHALQVVFYVLLFTPLLYHKTTTSDTGKVNRLCLIFLFIL